MTTASGTTVQETCDICLERFDIPKILPCGHTFCLDCIINLDKKGNPQCPYCRRNIEIPEGGVKDLVTNLAIQAPPKCLHHKLRIKRYCKNCNEGVCSTCILKQHKDHEIDDIDCGKIKKIIQTRFNPCSTTSTGELNDDLNMSLQFLSADLGNDCISDRHPSEPVTKSAISKQLFVLFSFLFNVSHIVQDGLRYFNKVKYRYNNLLWSCAVVKYDDNLLIDIELLPVDNLERNSCFIDGQISILNIDDDDSKTKTTKIRDLKSERSVWRSWSPITWTKLTNYNNGYLTSDRQFKIQCDIKYIK